MPKLKSDWQAQSYVSFYEEYTLVVTYCNKSWGWDVQQNGMSQVVGVTKSYDTAEAAMLEAEKYVEKIRRNQRVYVKKQ